MKVSSYIFINFSKFRIYKVTEDQSRSNSDQCDDDGQMVTIAVSVYVKRNSELFKVLKYIKFYKFFTGNFQKKTIYTTMIERSYVGWVEIDVKGTLRYWSTPKLNDGLVIDVYDADERQLDARNFFYLQDCKAGKSVVPFCIN